MRRDNKTSASCNIITLLRERSPLFRQIRVIRMRHAIRELPSLQQGDKNYLVSVAMAWNGETLQQQVFNAINSLVNPLPIMQQ